MGGGLWTGAAIPLLALLGLTFMFGLPTYRLLFVLPGAGISIAMTLEPDLIVISTQNRLGLRGRLAGSNTERILRGCNLPVLLIPSL